MLWWRTETLRLIQTRSQPPKQPLTHQHAGACPPAATRCPSPAGRFIMEWFIVQKKHPYEVLLKYHHSHIPISLKYCSFSAQCLVIVHLYEHTQLGKGSWDAAVWLTPTIQHCHDQEKRHSITA